MDRRASGYEFCRSVRWIFLLTLFYWQILGLGSFSSLPGEDVLVSWFKVAAVALGALVVFVVVSSVIGFLVEAVIAVLVVAVVVLGVKAAFNAGRIPGSRPDRQVRGPAGKRPSRRQTRDVEEELARLKRGMGN